MGAGLALKFKRRYRDYYEDYADKCDYSEIEPGKVDIYERTEGTDICSFPTKIDYRNKSQYSLVLRGLQHLVDVLENDGYTSVAIPAIGCGLGGLDWRRVESMIRDVFNNSTIHVELYPPL